MFYENYLRSDFHTNTVISRRVCLLVKMASKTVISPILASNDLFCLFLFFILVEKWGSNLDIYVAAFVSVRHDFQFCFLRGLDSGEDNL